MEVFEEAVQDSFSHAAVVIGPSLCHNKTTLGNVNSLST